MRIFSRIEKFFWISVISLFVAIASVVVAESWRPPTHHATVNLPSQMLDIRPAS